MKKIVMCFLIGLFACSYNKNKKMDFLDGEVTNYPLTEKWNDSSEFYFLQSLKVVYDDSQKGKQLLFKSLSFCENLCAYYYLGLMNEDKIQAIQSYYKVIELLEKSKLEFYPTYCYIDIVEIYLYIAILKEELGDFKGALVEINNAFRFGTSELNITYNLYHKPFETGISQKYNKYYKDIFNKYTIKDPLIRQIISTRGIINMNLNDLESAKRDFSFVVYLYMGPDNFDFGKDDFDFNIYKFPIFFLTEIDFKLKNYKAIIEIMNKYIYGLKEFDLNTKGRNLSNNNLVKAYLEKAKALALSENYNSAFECYNEILNQLNPNCKEALIGRGLMLMSLGKMVESCKDFNTLCDNGDCDLYTKYCSN